MKLPNLCYTSNLIVYEMNLVGLSMPFDHLMRRYPYHSSIIYKQHQSEGFEPFEPPPQKKSCPLNYPISNGDVRPSLRASRPWQPKGLGQVSHIESQVRFDVAGGSILHLVSSDQKTGIRRASWSGVNTRKNNFGEHLSCETPTAGKILVQNPNYVKFIHGQNKTTPKHRF